MDSSSSSQRFLRFPHYTHNLQVLDEYATQQEVYDESNMAEIPKYLLDGVDCAVMAYGQTGTGKTHLLLGPTAATSDLLIDLNTNSKRRPATLQHQQHVVPTTTNTEGKESTDHTRQHIQGAESSSQGVMTRVTTALFREIQSQVPTSTECIVKFSMVELYLEKFTDLLRGPTPLSSNGGGAVSSGASTTTAATVDTGESATTAQSSSSNIQQHGQEKNNINQIWVDHRSNLIGASELCCLSERDIYKAILRGSSFRTQSATEQNRDATRSHVILQLRVEQIDRITNTICNATLRVIDLAGSEQQNLASSSHHNSSSNKNKSNNSSSSSSRSQSLQNDNLLAMESRMVSASLQSLHNYIRAKLAQQQGKSSGNQSSRMHSPQTYANVSKLTKLLRASIDGPCFTTMFLTASPSSYNIGETLNTMKFGSRLRQLSCLPILPKRSNRIPHSNSPYSNAPLRDYPSILQQAETRVENLTRFVRLLAVECRTVRKTGKIRQPHAVWDVISRIAKASISAGGGETDIDDFAAEWNISIIPKKNTDVPEITDTEKLNKKIQELQLARTKADSSVRDYQSEVTTLRAEADLLKKEKRRLERELRNTKEELRSAQEKASEAERALRISQFRETESVVFLRQFRSFYLRLLKSKAAQGNGDLNAIVNNITKQVAGAPNLTELLDIDRLMEQSGLIESDEIGDDTNSPNYTPSEAASNLSETAANLAEENERKVLNDMAGGRIEQEPGLFISYRKKLVESPAGKLAIQKEKELEKDVIELSSKCIGLQNSLNAEKAMVEALSTRQGALGKMKAAQEMNILKNELERKTNDIQAIVWKMNELHLVNKTVNEKVENRESQIAFMDDNLQALETKTRQMGVERLESERKLREENSQLIQRLEGLMTKLWQLGEEPVEATERHKLIIPVSGEPVDLQFVATKAERRLSLGDIADEGLELLNPPPDTDKLSQSATVSNIEVSTQTDDVLTEQSDAGAQTDPIEIAVPTDKTTASIQTETTTLDSSVQTDDSMRISVDSEDMGIQACTDVANISVQTDEMQDSHNLAETIGNPSQIAEIGVQTDGTVKISGESGEAGTQTDFNSSPANGAVQTEETVRQLVKSEEAAVQTESSIVLAADMAIQTEGIVRIVQGSDDAIVQTERSEFETSETSCQTEIMASAVDSTDRGVQTHTELTFDVGVQAPEGGILDPIVKTTDTAAQTEHHDIVEFPRLRSMTERGVQTEMERTKICFEVETQTDDIASEVALQMSKSAELAGWMEFEELKPGQPVQRRLKLDKSNERPFKADQYGYKVDEAVGVSQHSNSSIGSIHSPFMEQSPKRMDKKPSVGEMNHGLDGSVPNTESWLGSSMSAIHGLPPKTVDWRAKLRQKGEDTAQTPNAASSRPKWSATSPSVTSLPKPPITSTPTIAEKSSNPSTTAHTPKPPTNQSQKSFASPTAPRTKRSVTPQVSTLPEWMQRFNEMGIKRDENDEVEFAVDETQVEDTLPSQQPANPNAKAKNESFVSMSTTSSISADSNSDKPEWLQKRKLSSNNGEVALVSPTPRESKTSSTAAVDVKTLPEPRKPEVVIVRRGSLIQTVQSPIPPLADPSHTISSANSEAPGKESELLQRFKKIGIKGVDQVVDADSPLKSPVTAVKSPLTALKSPVAAVKETAKHNVDPQPDTPLEKESKTREKDTPEWMQRFKEIGQKGPESVVMGSKNSS